MSEYESPYNPVKFEAHHASAVQALERGDCPEHLQKEFMRWLIADVCAFYEQSFRADPYSTAFVEGRRFVGGQLIKMIFQNPKSVAARDKYMKDLKRSNTHE